MSEQMRFKIRYAVEFGENAVASVARCIDDAIRENWQKYGQPWGWPLEDLSDRWQEWLSSTNQDRMTYFDEDDCLEDDLDPIISGEIELPFSPASRWLGDFGVSKSLKKRLCVRFRVSVNVQSDESSFSTKFDQDFLWRINNKCLFHIFDRLAAQFSVEFHHIDESFFWSC